MRTLTPKQAATLLNKQKSTVWFAIKRGVFTLVTLPAPGNFLSEEQVKLFIGKDLALDALSPEEREEWTKIKTLIESFRPEPEPPTPQKPKKKYPHGSGFSTPLEVLNSSRVQKSLTSMLETVDIEVTLQRAIDILDTVEHEGLTLREEKALIALVTLRFLFLAWNYQKTEPGFNLNEKLDVLLSHVEDVGKRAKIQEMINAYLDAA